MRNAQAEAKQADARPRTPPLVSAAPLVPDPSRTGDVEIGKIPLLQPA